MPLHLLVKWGRWFLQIVDIHVENFNMKLTGRWFPQIVDRDSGNLYPIYIYNKIVVLVSEPVRGRSRATELPCFVCISKHHNTPKPYWCPELSKLQDRKCLWWPIWVDNNRPRTVAVYDSVILVKKQFKKESRRIP